MIDHIADIKANCDLAIEGRDIKIKELEQEVEKHKWNDIFIEDCAGYDKKIAEEYTTLQERIKELEQELTVEKDLHQEEVNLHLHAEDYIKSLEQQIVKLKADIEQAIEDANRWEETETFSVLNRIYYDNFEITKEIEK